MVSILGPYLEVHQLSGMAKVRLPQNAAEPSNPCWVGDRSISSLMAGNRIPRVDIIMNPETLAVSQTPMTTHR